MALLTNYPYSGNTRPNITAPKPTMGGSTTPTIGGSWGGTLYNPTASTPQVSYNTSRSNFNWPGANTAFGQPTAPTPVQAPSQVSSSPVYTRSMPSQGMDSIDYSGSTLNYTMPGPAQGMDSVDFNSPTPSAPQAQPQQPQGFQTQYGTRENVEAYMNPYLDQIIDRGNRAIQSSAAARGLLGSSATLNNIGDWTAQATANEYGNAWGRFTGDRDYMTDNYWKTNGFNWDQYTYGNNSWNDSLGSLYDQMKGISDTGFNAGANAGTIQSNLGTALANLYGNRGDVGAMQAIQGGNNNSGLLSGLMSLLGGLL
jgi:hypothetical protein